MEVAHYTRWETSIHDAPGHEAMLPSGSGQRPRQDGLDRGLLRAWLFPSCRAPLPLAPPLLRQAPSSRMYSRTRVCV